MPLFDLTEFLRLSATLNYQLNASAVGRSNILAIISANRALSDEERDMLLAVVDYLEGAYGQRRRRLGPMAILHPLRATALLNTAAEEFSLLDSVTEMLHDKQEDIVGENFEPDRWRELEDQFGEVLARLDPSWRFERRLDWLTRAPEGETYYEYTGRLLENARNSPEMVRVKLADRLDNTLDLRVAVQDPLDRLDFYEHIFQVLFVNSVVAYEPAAAHRPAMPLNGAQRLYQLFKNTVILSLVRQKKAIENDAAASRLFEGIVIASMLEAQRIALHIFGYHYKEVAQQRELLIETMHYCQAGGTDAVARPTAEQSLDGLFVRSFDHMDHVTRNRSLEALYSDKPLMVQAAIAFIATFQNFLNDPDYFVQGVSSEGICPE